MNKASSIMLHISYFQKQEGYPAAVPPAQEYGAPASAPSSEYGAP